MAVAQESVAGRKRGELRKIENDELRPNPVKRRHGIVMYMKSWKCESATVAGCYASSQGTIQPYCECFAWHHDGFKCAWPYSV